MRMVGGVQWSEAWDDHSQTPEMLFAVRDSAAFFGSFPQAFPPGAHWAYTSGGYQLLQHMLRRAPPLALAVTWARPTGVCRVCA